MLCWFRIRTITLAFRRARACVCLYGFASVQNLGHTRLRHPCLACPSRCIDPLYFYNLLKSTSTASPRAKLASLVKGEVLSPEKIRATTGGIASPPSFACTNPSKTALSPSLFVMLTSVCTNMFSHPHYPTKTANTLASPRKRGGGTADTNFSLAVQYSDSPAFTILKLFRAVTVGIVSP